METSLVIQSASIGLPDTLLLMLLALMVFGPRRLPEIGRQVGKLMHEFRKLSNDFRLQMEAELSADKAAEGKRVRPATRLNPIQASDMIPQPATMSKIGGGTEAERVSPTNWGANHA
jgi:sec-independent protein translocase protein TatB